MQCDFLIYVCVYGYIHTISLSFFFTSLETTFLPPSRCLVVHTFIKGSDCFSVNHTELQLENGADQSGIESLSVWSDGMGRRKWDSIWWQMLDSCVVGGSSACQRHKSTVLKLSVKHLHYAISPGFSHAVQIHRVRHFLTSGYGPYFRK